MGNKWAMGEHEKYIRRYIFPFAHAKKFNLKYNPPYSVAIGTSVGAIPRENDVAFDTAIIDGSKFTVSFTIKSLVTINKIFIIDKDEMILHVINLSCDVVVKPGDTFNPTYNVELK